MVKSASFCGAGSHGRLFRGCVALTTRPSLSSLNSWEGWVAFREVGVGTAAFGAFATRMGAVADAIFVLLGRGIAKRTRSKEL
jgi:hypothetical protein